MVSRGRLFDLMNRIKKRGRPQIRTAEYWREYYTRKQREWRAAHRHSFFRNFAPPFSVEQVGMEAPACFPTNENVFALLRVARIIFESQVANDAAP